MKMKKYLKCFKDNILTVFIISKICGENPKFTFLQIMSIQIKSLVYKNIKITILIQNYCRTICIEK